MSEAREFLMGLISSCAGTLPLITLSYKIIMRIGLIRSSPEDFLIVNELLNTNPEHAK